MTDVDRARATLGLPSNRFADVEGGIGPGVRIVCKCVTCGELFESRSHDLADLDRICRGLCAAHKGTFP